jgi:hypothetical protein
MSTEEWQVDLSLLSATHSSGFNLRIDGDPADPSDVYPSNFPANLGFVEQTRLLRQGLEFIAQQAKTYKPAAALKSQQVLEREAFTKQFAERKDKPQRKQLSLKRTTES